MYLPGTSCGSTTCVGNLIKGQICNGLGSCISDSTGTDCSPYACNNSECTSPCSLSSHCVTGYFCDGGTCRAKQANGLACSAAEACVSGWCVDGFCCETACVGPCQACSGIRKGQGADGTCGPVLAGNDPDGDCPDDGAASCDRDGQCNGSGGCRLYAQGTSCAGPQCVGGELRPQQCDGLGSCAVAATGTSCTPYVCSGNACASPCTSDSSCVAGYYCNAAQACAPKLPQGDACAGSSQCAGGQCVDGVCCNSACTGKCMACSTGTKGQGADGECGVIVAGQDPDSDCSADDPATCGQDGACDGAGACRKYAQGTSCKADKTCVGTFLKASICDGLGTCSLESGGADCAPHVCSNGKCASPCGGAADCTPGNYCEAGQCLPKIAAGHPCTSDEQCSTGFCVDSLCCNTKCDGLCQACSAALKQSADQDGVCGAAANGLDPHNGCTDDGAPSCDYDGTCDGAEKCRTYAAGAKCGEMACVGSSTSGYKVESYQCDGAGTCVPKTTQDCGLSACVTDACKGACSADADCIQTAWCQGTACAEKSKNGATCTDKKTCLSGFCADGRCCDTLCNGQCEACNEPSLEGTCSPVYGAPRQGHTPCPAATGGDPCTARTCKGDLDRKQCVGWVGIDVKCRDASCTNGVATLEAVCEATGQCPEPKTSSCGAFACKGTTCGAKPCSSDADCSAKFACDQAKQDCVPRDVAACDGDHTVTAPDGTTQTDCSPYKCEVGANGGVCKDSCSVSTDCASGYVCDPQSAQCISATAAESAEQSGCGCKAVGRPRSVAGGAITLFLLAAAGVRTRRVRKSRLLGGCRRS